MDDLPLEEKCERLMNTVVDIRKRNGKKCKDYYQKISLIENQMLNHKLKLLSDQVLKSKNVLPTVDVEKMINETDEFKKEILERQKRLDALRQNVKNTISVVTQVKACRVTKKYVIPSTVEAILADAQNNEVGSDF